MRSILCCLLLVLPLTGRSSERLSLTPTADATLIEAAPTNSSGGQAFFVSGTTQNQTRNRGLLMFDIAASLPANATILSATLDLEVVHQGVDGQENSLFGIHRVLQSWGEGSSIATNNPGGRGAPAGVGDATWLYREFPVSPWSAPGGAAGVDYASAFSSSSLIAGLGTYNFESSFDTTADFQLWLEHPERNYGWMLVSQSEEIPFTARRFASREGIAGAPLLTLEYSLVPEPSTWLLCTLGAVIAFCFGRCSTRLCAWLHRTSS